MKTASKIVLAFVLCIILAAILNLEYKQNKQQQAVDMLNDKPEVTVEEPQKINGKWQIILYHANIVPTKIIKTSCYFVRDKIIWYLDASTGDELPLPEGAMIIPDDDRNLEDYGVYDIEFYNAEFD